VDLSEVDRFREEKMGDSEVESESISGTGCISPEEMKVILDMRNGVLKTKNVAENERLVVEAEKNKSLQLQNHEVALDEMARINDDVAGAEDEIVRCIRAAHNYEKLVRIIRERYTGTFLRSERSA
jgi:hypothetical protein